MKKLRRFTCGLLLGVCMTGSLTLAHAAEAGIDDRGRSLNAGPVPDRRPGAQSVYDAKGLPLGAFRAFPKLRLEGLYDDNVFRTSGAARDDLIFRVAPSMLLRSEWSRHKLSLDASLESLKYSDLSSEDVLNWHVGAAGQLDIVRAAYIAADFSFYQLHEPRSSPDDQFGSEPTPFKKLTAGTSLHFKPNRFGVVVAGDFTRYDYDPVALAAPLAGVLPNDDRDRNIYSGRLRASYDFAAFATFVEGVYETRTFDQTFDRFGIQRDSTGYAVRGGIAAHLSRLLEGEIYAGYLRRSYKGALPDITGFDFAANVTWYATPLTTVRLEAAYNVSDTTLAFVSGSSDRSVQLSVEHELLRNLLLRGNVGYMNSAYEGSVRDDKIFSAGVGAEYLLNRYLSLGIKYNHQSRSSSIAGQDFTNNVISLGLRAQL